MLFFLAAIMLIFLVAVAINHFSKKSNERYSKYLEDLEIVKERKRNRSQDSNIGGRWLKIKETK